jgi:hypothetical protein
MRRLFKSRRLRKILISATAASRISADGQTSQGSFALRFQAVVLLQMIEKLHLIVRKETYFVRE